MHIWLRPFEKQPKSIVNSRRQITDKSTVNSRRCIRKKKNFLFSFASERHLLLKSERYVIIFLTLDIFLKDFINM